MSMGGSDRNGKEAQEVLTATGSASKGAVPIVCAHGSLARQCRVCELEQEVADLTRQLHTEQDRRWTAESSLSVRYAMRREIEHALGITPGMANNDALRAGLAAITALRADCDRLRAVVRQVMPVTCDDVHHDKRDRHGLDEPCPVLARARAALGRGEGE